MQFGLSSEQRLLQDSLGQFLRERAPLARVRRHQVEVNSIYGHHFADVPGTRSPDQVTMLEEEKISAYYGAGTFYAYTIMYHAGDRRFAAAIPYASVIVELDDAPGALLAANLLEAPYTEAKVGRRVEVIFEPLNDDITLPQFRLAR